MTFSDEIEAEGRVVLGRESRPASVMGRDSVGRYYVVDGRTGNPVFKVTAYERVGLRSLYDCRREDGETFSLEGDYILDLLKGRRLEEIVYLNRPVDYEFERMRAWVLDAVDLTVKTIDDLAGRSRIPRKLLDRELLHLATILDSLDEARLLEDRAGIDQLRAILHEVVRHEQESIGTAIEGPTGRAAERHGAIAKWILGALEGHASSGSKRREEVRGRAERTLAAHGRARPAVEESSSPFPSNRT